MIENDKLSRFRAGEPVFKAHYSQETLVEDEKIRAEHRSGHAFLFEGSKRVFDIVFALAALPLLIALSILIWTINMKFNPGPLFYSQERVGKDGVEFTIFKFRTMRSEKSRERGATDPLERSRITPFGGWMRQCRMDELPQILNILRGDMSLVGPRPEFSAFVEEYRDKVHNYDLRSKVRPGITGLAQVEQGYTETLEAVRQKSRLDNYYVRNRNWRLDLYIIFRTFGTVTSGVWPERSVG